jgi:hypothetical protein
MKTYAVLNEALRHEDNGGVEVYFHTLLISALDGGEWSVSRPGRFKPWERNYLRCV